MVNGSVTESRTRYRDIQDRRGHRAEQCVRDEEGIDRDGGSLEWLQVKSAFDVSRKTAKTCWQSVSQGNSQSQVLSYNGESRLTDGLSAIKSSDAQAV